MRLRRNDEMIVVGDYELRVRVFHAGTRSEGRLGRLYHRGIEVEGRMVGEVIDAGARQFVFRGTERSHPWTTSGWMPAPAPPEPASPDARS